MSSVSLGVPCIQRLLQRIHYKLGPYGHVDPPAHYGRAYISHKHLPLPC